MNNNYERFMKQDKHFGEITVFAMNKETEMILLQLAQDFSEDGKLNIGGVELMGGLFKLMTDFPEELIDDSELFNEILESPSDEVEDVIEEIEKTIKRFFKKFQKNLDTVSALPQEVLEQVVEAESEKAIEDENYRKYLELKEQFKDM